MELHKLENSYITDFPAEAGLKGACILLPGPLLATVETIELPKNLPANLPAVILCKGCDSYLERLLNERGVSVTTPVDPVDAIPDGAEIELDLTGGRLTELSSGRKFALKPLQPAHLQSIRNHG